MCGIGGIISNNGKPLSKEVMEKVPKLISELESRGQDAWGIYLSEAGKKQKNLNCWEEDKSLNGELFKISKSFTDWSKSLKGKMYLKNIRTALVHTRAETKGSSDENKNNHPFHTKDFVLAHNGVISNAELLKDDYNLNYDIETDSYIIIALIQKFVDEGDEIVDAIRHTISLLVGSFACWLYHKKTGDVYLFRDTNPLNYYIDKENNTFLFASTSLAITNISDAIYSDIEVLPSDRIFKVHNGRLIDLGEFNPESNKLTKVGLLQSKHKVSNNDINLSLNQFRYLLRAVSKYQTDYSLIPNGDLVIIIFKSTLLRDAILETDYAQSLSKLGHNSIGRFKLTVKRDDIPDLLLEILNSTLFDYSFTNFNVTNHKDYWLILALNRLKNELNLEFILHPNGVEIFIEPTDEEFVDTKNYLEKFGLSLRKSGNLFIRFDSDAFKCLKRAMRDKDIFIN